MNARYNKSVVVIPKTIPKEQQMERARKMLHGQEAARKANAKLTPAG